MLLFHRICFTAASAAVCWKKNKLPQVLIYGVNWNYRFVFVFANNNRNNLFLATRASVSLIITFKTSERKEFLFRKICLKMSYLVRQKIRITVLFSLRPFELALNSNQDICAFSVLLHMYVCLMCVVYFHGIFVRFQGSSWHFRHTCLAQCVNVQ